MLPPVVVFFSFGGGPAILYILLRRAVAQGSPFRVTALGALSSVSVPFYCRPHFSHRRRGPTSGRGLRCAPSCKNAALETLRLSLASGAYLPVFWALFRAESPSPRVSVAVRVLRMPLAPLAACAMVEIFSDVVAWLSEWPLHSLFWVDFRHLVGRTT